MWKKIAAILLAVSMLCSLLVVPAAADGFEGVAFVNEDNYFIDVDGQFSFDDVHQILTLNNVSADGGLIEQLAEGFNTLTIVLKGTNQLNYINAFCNLVFEGDGTLNLIGAVDGLYPSLKAGSVTVNSGTLNVTTRTRDNNPGGLYTAIHCMNHEVHTFGGTYTTSGNFVMNGGTVNISIPDPNNSYYQDLECVEQLINGGVFNTNMQTFHPRDDDIIIYTNKNPFSDVSKGMYYYAPVKWASLEGITNGTSATTFSPNDTCTRGQIITFLWRTNEMPNPKGTGYVADNKVGTYYEKAIQWAKENDLFDGNTFYPEAPCTRAMAVEFIWRDWGRQSAQIDGRFSDVPNTASYLNAVYWAAARGITTGTDTTHFSPDQICTRGQIVTFLFRTFVRTPEVFER